MERCELCKYFFPDLIQGRLKHTKGYCKVNGPQLLDRLVERHSVKGLVGLELSVECSLYPGVDAADCCGQWKPKK